MKPCVRKCKLKDTKIESNKLDIEKKSNKIEIE